MQGEDGISKSDGLTVGLCKSGEAKAEGEKVLEKIVEASMED